MTDVRGGNPLALRMVAAFLTALVVAVAVVVMMAWRALFPPDPFLDRLAEDELPAWATGTPPPADATVSFDAPDDWRLAEGEEASPAGGPLQQRWNPDDGPGPTSVVVEVARVEGLAEAERWPNAHYPGTYRPVDFDGLDAYTRDLEPVGDYDPEPGGELLVRIGNDWGIKIEATGEEPDVLMAIAERVVFDPSGGGEDPGE